MTDMFIPATADAPKSVTVEGAKNVSTLGANQRSYRKGKIFGTFVDFNQVAKDLVKPGHSVYSTVSANFMMSAEDAGEVMRALLTRHNIIVEADYIRLAFIDALIECYAINSSSLQMPGRASFTLCSEGHEPRVFDFYSDVIQILGDDARRFFRAYADYTRERLKLLQTEVMAGPVDPPDAWDAKAEMWDHVCRVAADRGLVRYPYLIHDSADACTGLTAPERVAVMQSKTAIITAASETVNLIDGPAGNRGSLAPSLGKYASSRPASVGASKYDDY